MPATRSPPGASDPDGPQGDAVTDPPELLPDGLTDDQRRAVTHTGAPLLVVAGPGAGKTSVMVRRAAWLVEERGVDPSGLLVTTFTNEAAEELFDRLHRFLGARTNDVHISTLQSVARGILYDEDLHDTAEGGEQGPSGAGGRVGGGDQVGPTLPLDGRDPDRADARREARCELRDRFRHLLVDEYQDTNRLQVEILRSLAKPDYRITAVGDDDQSIYGFRGASPSSFLRFERDFPGAETVRLRTNFRSTPPLVEAATRLIDHNAPDRRPKELEPDRDEPEFPPAVVDRETSPEEAEAVVETLAGWKERGLIGSWSEVTLLFRSVKSYAGPYLEAMAERGIPFEVDADGAFFDRDDVQQMKRLFTFCGWKSRWRTEALAGPVTGLSPRTLEALDEWEGDPVEWTDPEVLDEVGVGDERERRVLAGLGELRRCTLDHEYDDDLLELFYDLLEVTGYLERCCEEGPCGPEDPEREAALLNLAVFSQLLAAFHRHVRSTNTYRLGQYLRDLPWRHLDERSPEPETDAVRVMTVHAAKGLEFPVVVLGAAMQDRFPGRYRPSEYPVPPGLKLSGDRIDEGRHYRDERRLFYVGMTRAEDVLVVGTADKVNKRGGGPSQFVEEVGEAIRPAPEMEEDADPEALQREAGDESEARERVSYSALHSYLLCPLQYYLTHEADFAVPERYYFEFGRLVHRALEILHRRAADGVAMARVAFSNRIFTVPGVRQLFTN